ncbi:MAG TPA: 8-amino-7-oxononanoate synthase [Trebonia sp.]|jgi:8-amino-7-oxononanoate synthase|nr:8-amino-7-oxononanoate synthase [Trebonia sp.]
MEGDFDPVARLREHAAGREAAGLRRRLVPRQPDGGLLDLASNDYLGLCGHPRLAEAAAEAARTWGTGATGSRLVTGTTALHEELEAALAEFAGARSALVFSSGYLANLAAVTALTTALGSDGGETLIVSDAGNHASLIDGCRLARGRGARLQVTPHGDLDAVARALRERRERAALIVTDAVFSVGGDLAPVAELHALARRHGALLLVDEAHSFGVLGDGGRGVAHDAGLGDQPDIVRTITLSKSLSGQGGAVLGAPEVRQALVDTGRGFIFDTGLAPPAAGAALAALAIVREHPELPEGARQATRRLASIAAGLGLRATPPDAAVTSVILGDPRLAVAAQRTCGEHGVHVGCFRPPSVPPGESCLRLTGRASLTEIDFATASRALGAVRDHSRIPEKSGGRAP